MMKTKFAAGVIATALLAGTAMAQTSSGTSSGTMNSTAPSATVAPSTSAAGAGSMQFISNEQGSQWRASKLMGVDIYGPNDEKVGDVNEIILDHQGAIKGVVIGVGGFLGMGEKDVAVPFSSIQWSDTPRNASMASGSSASGTAAGTSAGMNTANNTAAAPTHSTAAGAGATAPSTDTTGTVARAGAAERSYPDHGKISMTKDQLKGAPAYNLR
ncbi:PRC-barrel domain-containing protein [Alsobacter sp. KACC 23698]|uniref:PRC-barrel domain-containing protein n=1 Tax=Alsobacter sp. KACC 23698 TaxID=3149229 RepID=A0AAU7JFN7_9HYPH